MTYILGQRLSREALLSLVATTTSSTYTRWLSPRPKSAEDVRTAVLLVPSLWQEAFGLVAVEAQLRGICVVSTGRLRLYMASYVLYMAIYPVAF